MKTSTQIMIGAGALGVVALVAWKGLPALASAAKAAGAAAVDTAAGVVTGNNQVTQTATNAAGERTTAYEGAGIFGTAGATVNAASGGTLASIGESIGGWFFDLTHPSSSAPADKYERPPQTTSATVPIVTPYLTYSDPGASFADLAAVSAGMYGGPPLGQIGGHL